MHSRLFRVGLKQSSLLKNAPARMFFFVTGRIRRSCYKVHKLSGRFLFSAVRLTFSFSLPDLYVLPTGSLSSSSSFSWIFLTFVSFAGEGAALELDWSVLRSIEFKDVSFYRRRLVQPPTCLLSFPFSFSILLPLAAPSLQSTRFLYV